MKWKIEFYQKENEEYPVKKFIDGLTKKHFAKALWEIGLLEEYGTVLKEPYAKAIKGEEYKGIWELRIKFASDISRIFYFMPIGDKFVLLHGFVKKTEETPASEIDIAKRYMNDYKRRFC